MTSVVDEPSFEIKPASALPDVPASDGESSQGQERLREPIDEGDYDSSGSARGLGHGEIQDAVQGDEAHGEAPDPSSQLEEVFEGSACGSTMQFPSTRWSPRRWITTIGTRTVSWSNWNAKP